MQIAYFLTSFFIISDCKSRKVSFLPPITNFFLMSAPLIPPIIAPPIPNPNPRVAAFPTEVVFKEGLRPMKNHPAHRWTPDRLHWRDLK